MKRPLNLKKMSGIYQIKNILNNKCYVGGAHNLYDRYRHHVYLLNKNKHHSIILQRAWNKYGENAFEFVVLKFCEKIDVRKYEQEFIDKINPEYNRTKNAYGGLPIGFTWNEEDKKIIYEKKQKTLHSNYSKDEILSWSKKPRPGHSEIRSKTQKENWKNPKFRNNLLIKMKKIRNTPEYKEQQRKQIYKSNIWKCGEEHHESKLTTKEVKDILKQYKPYIVTAKMLAERYGVSVSLIEKIISGVAWKHIKR